MFGTLRESIGQFLENGLLLHFFSIGGFILAFFLVARLMSEKRAPANTLAWLLIIVLVPYVGVPLYLMFGGRKLRRLIARKSQLIPTLPRSLMAPASVAAGPVAHTVTAAGGSGPVAGNRLRLLTTGEDEFAALERNIRQAKHSIHIMTFILSRDDVGRRIIALLAERAREGVKVRLLLDALGCPLSSLFFANPLRRAGGKVARFMPVVPFISPSTANLRNHRKIAIFDHATAIMGGRNLALEYMGPSRLGKRWQDFGAEVEGPAAALLNEVFIADWCFTTGETPASLHEDIPSEVAQGCGASELQVVPSGPDVRGDALYESIVAMIQEAQHDIWIVTPYFIPDEVLLRSLMVKARAGCRVTLVVPEKSNHPVTDFARRYYVRELRRAGARVMLYTGGMLHAKTIVADDRTALLGSPNFDLRSLLVNFEIGLLVHSPADVLAITAWVQGLLPHCRESKAETGSAGRRLFGDVAEDLSRLLAPLL